MLCEICVEREARVFMTSIVEGKMTKKNICEECFEAQYPDAAAQAKTMQERDCQYCGKKGPSICRRCSVEMQRFMEEKGFHSREDAATGEQMEDPLRRMNEIARHMRKWVQDRESDPDDSEEDGGARLFERLAGADSRFAADAYDFVFRAVAFAAGTKGGDHVSGREVALAFRALALKEYGKEALPTLIEWGVYTTDDIGLIVGQLAGAGLLGARPEDKKEDFHAIYDFGAAFPTA